MSKKGENYNKILRASYKAYCFEANNDGADMDKLRWKPSKFHVFLCDTVQRFLEEETGHPYDILLISTPPQHGKSKTITECLPSWYLGRHPEHRVIEISYSETFAQKFGRRNKEKIARLGGLFGIELSSSTRSNTEFELSNKKGGMLSRGVGSGVTGEPCNLMIIDDPIKNRQEADSEVTRNHIWDEWNNSFKTRLSAGAKVIVIQTRWHEDDLYGKLMNDPFSRSINVPLEAEKDDPLNDVLGRKPGDALCADIGKDNDWLKGFKESFLSGEIDEGGESGRRAWDALMQGHPTALEGNLFKRTWWRYYSYSDYVNRKLTFDYMVMSVDATFKDKDDNDFVAIQCWAKKGINMYLVDAVKDHLGYVDTCNAIIGMKAHYPQISGIWIEDKANGSAIIDLMRRQIPGIIGIEPQGGKYARASAITSYIEAGNVYLPRDRDFTGSFIDEMAEFPNGKHDDQCDACSQCISRLGQMRYYNGIPEPPKSLVEQFTGTADKKYGIGEKLIYV